MAFVRSLNLAAHKDSRRGAALILTAVILIPLLALLAFVVDWGRLCVTKAELQRAADASAMAAAWELLESKGPGNRLDAAQVQAGVRKAAMTYAAMNSSFGKPLELQDEDIEIGYLANPLAPGGQMDTSNPARFNAVRIHVRRDAESNGSVPMFFARVIGKDRADCRASATAAFIDNIAGFRKPLADDGPHIPMLPLALDIETWHNAVSGLGRDEWKWDVDANKFVMGSDGIPEFNLYPNSESKRRNDDDDDDRRDGKHRNSKHNDRSRNDRGHDDDDDYDNDRRGQKQTDSTGDRGTVNIGSSGYNAQNVARQILYGVSLKDWEFHNGGLTFDENGELLLGGKRGIDPAFDVLLASIRGQGRIIPVFREVNGQGDATVYTLVEWAGIRIVEADLHGKEKQLIVQAGEVTTAGAVPADETQGTTVKSRFIRSRVWLAR